MFILNSIQQIYLALHSSLLSSAHRLHAKLKAKERRRVGKRRTNESRAKTVGEARDALGPPDLAEAIGRRGKLASIAGEAVGLDFRLDNYGRGVSGSAKSGVLEEGTREGKRTVDGVDAVGKPSVGKSSACALS